MAGEFQLSQTSKILYLSFIHVRYRWHSTTHIQLSATNRMALHRPLRMTDDKDDDEEEDEEYVTYERPDRILWIYHRLLGLQKQLVQKPSSSWYDASSRFIKLECIPAHRQAITAIHSSEMYDDLYKTQFMTDEELMELTNSKDDLYYNRYTFQAATLAAGGVIQCVDHVTSKFSETTRAIALVRPPGHHAVRDSAMGKQRLIQRTSCFGRLVRMSTREVTHFLPIMIEIWLYNFACVLQVSAILTTLPLQRSVLCILVELTVCLSWTGISIMGMVFKT